jgi:hypothetical protein
VAKKNSKSKNVCPICAAPRRESGLPLAVPFGIPTYWAPNQALAIFEFIDEMRDIIAAVYCTGLHNAARRRANPIPDNANVISDDDLPF